MEYIFKAYKKNALVFSIITATVFFSFHIFVSYISSFFIPYYGVFSYSEIINQLQFPNFIEGFVNFDGLHYLKIADAGYEKNSPAIFSAIPFSYEGSLSIYWNTFIYFWYCNFILLSCGNNLFFSKIDAKNGIARKPSHYRSCVFYCFSNLFFYYFSLYRKSFSASTHHIRFVFL